MNESLKGNLRFGIAGWRIVCVNVGQNAMNRHVAQCVFKEEQLNGGRADKTETRQQEQQPTESSQLPRIPGAERDEKVT